VLYRKFDPFVTLSLLNSQKFLNATVPNFLNIKKFILKINIFLIREHFKCFSRISQTYEGRGVKSP